MGGSIDQHTDRGVGDELAEEDLLVRVDRVDDDVQELPRLRLELVLLSGTR